MERTTSGNLVWCVALCFDHWVRAEKMLQRAGEANASFHCTLPTAWYPFMGAGCGYLL